MVNCHPRLRRKGKKNAGARILVLTRGVGLRAGTFFCKKVYFSLRFVGFILILFLFTKWRRPWKRFLLEQLDQPVLLKNGSVAENPRTGEPLMPEEAICMSIVQKAMKGDIQAASYINNVKKWRNMGGRSKKEDGVVIDIEQLKQDDHNFNNGTAAGKKLMEKSFAQFGAGRSILVDKENRIIAGNKSQLAAMGAGIKKVRVIETTGDELIAVKRTDIELDSKEGRELALADNLTTQVNLSWDGAELAGVKEQYGIDLEGWGADDLLPALPDDKEAKEDNFDEKEEKIETRCKPGDIWQLGEHRLMCGDSTKQADVLKLMNGDKADLWLTDPPYNVAVQNSQGMTIVNDDMDDKAFFEFLSSAFKNAQKVMSKGCPFYV